MPERPLESEIRAELKEIRQDLAELREEMTKYKGFVGGVVWLGGALLAGAMLMFQFLKNH